MGRNSSYSAAATAQVQQAYAQKASEMIPTLAEQEEIGYIIEAVFSSSGITLYAIDEPTVALVLEVKGDYYLFDCGGDIERIMKDMDLPIGKIKAV